MKTHDKDGTPYTPEELLGELMCLIVPAQALAHAVIEGDAASALTAEGLAYAVKAFCDDLEVAWGAAGEWQGRQGRSGSDSKA